MLCHDLFLVFGTAAERLWVESTEPNRGYRLHIHIVPCIDTLCRCNWRKNAEDTRQGEEYRTSNALSWPVFLCNLALLARDSGLNQHRPQINIGDSLGTIGRIRGRAQKAPGQANSIEGTARKTLSMHFYATFHYLADWSNRVDGSTVIVLVHDDAGTIGGRTHKTQGQKKMLTVQYCILVNCSFVPQSCLCYVSPLARDSRLNQKRPLIGIATFLAAQKIRGGEKQISCHVVINTQTRTWRELWAIFHCGQETLHWSNRDQTSTFLTHRAGAIGGRAQKMRGGCLEEKRKSVDLLWHAVVWYCLAYQSLMARDPALKQ